MGREKRARRARAEAVPAAKIVTPPARREPPPRGLPGERGGVLVRNEFKGNDPRNSFPLGGAPGQYKVLFTLSRPGVLPVPERDFSFSPDLPGDSHLAIAPPALKWPDGSPEPAAIRVYATTEDGAIIFSGKPNERGFLGKLESELTAQSIRDAEQKAYRALASSLSNWSAQLDIPLHVWRAHVTEVATGSTHITVTNPFDEAALALPSEGIMTREYRAFVGFYREALENNSAAYRFLCLFKIAEGIRKRRERAATDAIARGEMPMRLGPERIPKNPAEFPAWLNGIYPRREWDELTIDSVFIAAARGRKINDLLDRELVDLRNDVAHALSNETGTIALSVDEALHLVRVEGWLPLLRCIVRRMMKNEFPDEFLSHLAEDGTVRVP